LEMIKNKVEKNLEAEGVKEIKVKVSEARADGYYHEIVATEENSELAPNTILEVIKKGYLLRDQVLKASQVKITAHSQNPKQLINEVVENMSLLIIMVSKLDTFNNFDTAI
ncbi:8096_t:CDS:2, partial [Racocetra fulgida]